jgi:hypothetical protein
MHTLTFTVFPEAQAPYVATLPLRAGASVDAEGNPAPAIPAEAFSQGGADFPQHAVDAASSGVLLLGTRYGEVLTVANVVHADGSVWVDVALQAWPWGDMRAASARWKLMTLNTMFEGSEDAADVRSMEALWAGFEALTPLPPAHGVLRLVRTRPAAGNALPAITTTLRDPQADRMLSHSVRLQRAG